MPPSQTPRQIWAQQRIDEVYADNAHPYFAKSDGRKGRLNAAMLRLNQVTAPPNRPQPGQQLISAATLMGSDAFAKAEDAAEYLTQAAVLSPQISQGQPQPPKIDLPVRGQLRNDDMGRGAYGASRDEGTRKHKAVDLVTTPGEAVSSPIDGKIGKHGFVHGDNKREHYYVEVEGTGKHAGMSVRILYFEKKSRLAIGTPVKAGQSKLGLSDDVRLRYGNRMKPHVHVQVKWHGKFIDPSLVLPDIRADKP